MNYRLAMMVISLFIVGCSAAAATDDPDPGTGDDSAEETGEIVTDHSSLDKGSEEEPPVEPAADEMEKIAAGDDSPYEGSPYETPPYDREYDASELFDAVCAGCHGEEGDGDAPIEDPFSFGTPADQWTNGPTVEGILITLEDGIHDTAMREFPEYKNADREELAAYVLELRYALEVAE